MPHRANLSKQYQQSMAYQVAEIYAYRGDSDLAFQWLNRAYQQHDNGMRNLKIDPLLKSLHQDPRYSELLQKMHLVQSSRRNQYRSRTGS